MAISGFGIGIYILNILLIGAGIFALALFIIFAFKGIKAFNIYIKKNQG